MTFFLACEDAWRRDAVRGSDRAGIDYVEVDENDQRLLRVYLFGNVPQQIGRENVRVDGGRRIRDLVVTDVSFEHHDDEDRLLVRVDRAGDFSPYTLQLVEADDGRPSERPLATFDPRYAAVDFGFKVGCPSDLDCQPDPACPPPVRPMPAINYLAKDYASFRQLILDRLALVMPDWRETHVPDLGITLVELLAYVGDYLSYYQDAVATEAYLDTARLRISVRRHARLVDYHLHEGANARAWLTVRTDHDVTDGRLQLTDVYFTTASEVDPTSFEPIALEPSGRLVLYRAHNDISFYTWGDERCCLPRGATTATLLDGLVFEQPSAAPPVPNPAGGARTAAHDESTPAPPKRALHLAPGELLVFEEVLGPRTGRPEDADPAHRHVLRVTRVTPVEDPLFPTTWPGSDESWPTPLLEVEWAPEDALPFPLCISARLDAPDCSFVEGVSVAHGNVLLVDHGRTVDDEPLGQVGIHSSVGRCECDGSAVDVQYVAADFRPELRQAPLTHREAPPSGALPAAALLVQDPRNALPCVVLTGLPGTPDGKVRDGVDASEPQWHWHPERDLLDSSSEDQAFVAEVDDDGRAHLRLGDGELGRRPDPSTLFLARYRVGNGPTGNVGADTITIARFRQSVSGLALQPRNPLPASGGTAPEPIAEAKLLAPRTFARQLERAITADDYARLAERTGGPRLQRAGAALRWTGTWYAADVAVDPGGTETPSAALLRTIARGLHRYRRMGHDLAVHAARYVPLEIALCVRVRPHYLRGHVEATLLDVLGTRALPDGRLGFFHPDNLTFGEDVRPSRLVAVAQAVPGVESVRVKTLQRLGEGDAGELAAGILPLGPLEIAQLDNDPSFPERGTLKLELEGGR